MWILEAFGGGERFRRGDPLRLRRFPLGGVLDFLRLRVGVLERDLDLESRRFRAALSPVFEGASPSPFFGSLFSFAVSWLGSRFTSPLS